MSAVLDPDDPAESAAAAGTSGPTSVLPLQEDSEEDDDEKPARLANSFDGVAEVASRAVGVALALQQRTADLGDVATLAVANTAAVEALATVVNDLLQLRDPVIRARVDASARAAGASAVTEIELAVRLERANAAYADASMHVLQLRAETRGATAGESGVDDLRIVEELELAELNAASAVSELEALILFVADPGSLPHSGRLSKAFQAAILNLEAYYDTGKLTRNATTLVPVEGTPPAVNPGGGVAMAPFAPEASGAL